MLLAFKLKQSDLAEQIQTAGELNDQAYKQMVQINNDFKKALMTPITIASFDPSYELGDCISQTKTSVAPNEVTEYEY